MSRENDAALDLLFVRPYSTLAFNDPLWQALAMLMVRLIIGLLMLSARCPGVESAPRLPPVLVEYFYAAGCDECRVMEDEVLPHVRDLMGDFIDLRSYDFFSPTNYLRLAALQEKCGVRTSERVSVYVDERIHLGGLQAIKARLIPTVEAASLARTEAGQRKREANADLSAIASATATSEAVLHRRLESWTLPAVAAAGLVDGLNPCAFATIIFFMTLLAVAGKRGKELIAVGAGFCGAVFATYFLLGFGVFHVIQQIAAYHLAGEMLRWLMIAVLSALCIVSFKDAWMFCRTGNARAMTLQLPDALRRRIHGVMRTRLTSRHLLAGSFAIGCLVTLLESVCTGQVYVPTLVYLTRHPEWQRRALGLLLVYNVAFVIPHVIVCIAAYRGVSNERLLAWSRSNGVWSKVLLGLFFGVLAAMFWAL